MAKEKPVFHSYDLPNKEYEYYTCLSEQDQKIYEKNWVSVESQKLKLAQARARMQKARADVSARERKARTRRLIEIGAAVESVLKKSLGDTDGVLEGDDIQALIDYLQNQEDRGQYFSRAIVKARSKREHIEEDADFTEDFESRAQT